jgi:hypothetical protein
MIKKGIILLISAIGLILLITNTDKVNSYDSSFNSPTTGAYKAVCLPNAADLKGADQALRPYYHIAHIPREGGHCYIRFPTSEVVRLNPQQAENLFQQGLPRYGLSYPGTQGTLIYFKNPTKYQDLINKLKQRPPVSRNTYASGVVTTTREVREQLSEPLDFDEDSTADIYDI